MSPRNSGYTTMIEANANDTAAVPSDNVARPSAREHSRDLDLSAVAREPERDQRIVVRVVDLRLEARSG
jgi:hypothetical protein